MQDSIPWESGRRIHHTLWKRVIHNRVQNNTLFFFHFNPDDFSLGLRILPIGDTFHYYTPIYNCVFQAVFFFGISINSLYTDRE